MTRGQKSRCRQIAERYGRKNQEAQAISELTELQYVLTRRPDQRQLDWKNDLIDEMADVLIMVEQLRALYGVEDDELTERVNFKLNRQIDRILNGG